MSAGSPWDCLPCDKCVSTEAFSIRCLMQPSSFSALVLECRRRDLGDIYILMSAEGHGHILHIQKT